MWVSAVDVAKAAVDGLAKGRPVVIPGLPNRVLAVGGPPLAASAACCRSWPGSTPP